MITIEKLIAYGADTKTGLARCMGNEGFYLRLVGMEMADPNFARLEKAAAEGETRAAFEAAHALKGAVGNLALTPLYDPLCEVTELLRNATGPVDTGDLIPAIRRALDELKALAE